MMVMDDGTAAVHNRTVVTGGTAPVHHGVCLMVRAVAVHNRTVVTDGAAFVRHGLCLMTRTGFMHGLCSLNGRFMNGRSCLVTGTLPLHRGFHLMGGGASLRFPPNLLGLRGWFAAAARTGRRCFGYAHYERSA